MNRIFLKTASVLLFFLITEIIYPQGLGMTTNGMDPPTFHLKKGEKVLLMNFGIIGNQDLNDDGAAGVYLFNFNADLLNCFSFQPNSSAESELSPYQSEDPGGGIYMDTKDLAADTTFDLFFLACSEISSGPIGGRVCIGKHKTIIIEPYIVPLTELLSHNGSYSKIILGWQLPSPLYWNLHHFEIVRSNSDSVGYSNIENSEVVVNNISSEMLSYQINDAERGVNPFYAIVTYDSLGEAIGISQSYQVAYEKNNFSLISPNDGEILKTTTPTLDWEDYGGVTSYTVWYSEDSTFSTKTEVSGITTSNYSITNPLEDHKTYYWKVKTDGEVFSDETGWNFSINISNNSPSQFSLFSPANNSNLNTLRPSFIWDVALDEGDRVNYNILIALDESFINIVINDTTKVPYYYSARKFDDNNEYFWKVKAIDSEGEEAWSTNTFSFDINFDDYPSKFELVFPKWNYGEYGSNELPVETNLFPEFKWRKSSDGDGINNITYSLWYSTDSTFEDKIQVDGITDTFYTPTIPLIEDKYYYWQVFAIDENGNETNSSGFPFAFVTNSQNSIPTTSSITQPQNAETIDPDNNIFSWTSSTDSDLYDYIIYDILISNNITFTDTAYIFRNIRPTEYEITHLDSGSYYAKIITRSVRADFIDGGINSGTPIHFSVNNSRLTLKSPNAYGKWAIGQSPYIRWEDNFNVRKISIDYSTDNGISWVSIVDSIDGSPTRYQWTIPNILANQSVKLRAIGIGLYESIAADTSITFNITEKPDSNRLALYFTFDGNLTDYSGNGLDAMPSAPQNEIYDEDRFGNEGKSYAQYYSFPPTYLDMSNGFSYSVWAKNLDINSRVILFKFGNSDDIFPISLEFLRGISFNFGNRTFAIPQEREDGWNHYVAIINSTGALNIYINRHLIITDTISLPEMTQFSICYGDNHLKRIDDLRLFGRTLSKEEIDNLFFENFDFSSSISLNSLNNGDSIQCTKQMLQWTATNVRDKRIEFSSDGGTTWSTIIDYLDSTQISYEWSVPRLQSDSCYIRIRDRYRPFVSDTTDQPFTIWEHFSYVDTPPGFAGTYGTAIWGDFNNDNKMDLFKVSRWHTRFYKNVDSTFEEFQNSTDHLKYSNAEWFDYNNDGKIDAVFTGYVYIVGDPTVQFVLPTMIYKNDTDSMSRIDKLIFGTSDGDISYADYDNDGDQDLFIIGGNDQGWPLPRLYNNNNSIFEASLISFPNLNNSKSEWIDFDNDRDLDLIITGSDMTSIYINNRGYFTPLAITLIGTNSGDVKCFDYNCDGKIDILITGSGHTKLYKNLGNLNFEEVLTGLPNLYFSSAAIGDLNNDGFSDIILSGSDESGSKTRIYFNLNGNFIENDDGLPASGYRPNLDLADFNNDSHLDLFYSDNLYSEYVFRYNTGNINAPPSSPSSLFATLGENEVLFSWSKSSDDHTPSDGLTYNLRIGTTPNGNEIMSAMSDPISGYRRIPGMGNVQTNTSWIIKNLKPGTYYWSVQAIDNTYAGSGFAPEQTFTIGTGVRALPEGLYKVDTNTLSKRDTVKGYLRNIVDPYSVVDSAVAIIDSLSFLCNFEFTHATSGEYYLVIKHRNSIETWSNSDGISFIQGSPITYSFTSNENRAYGNNMKHKGSKWCVYVGEIANGDEYIDGDDVTAAFNAQGLSGYVIEDVTGDDYVDGDDVTLVFNNQGVGAMQPPISSNDCPTNIYYEGKVYNTVQIGTQCWLKENLDVGTIITGEQDPNNNGIIEKYCYQNLAANCNVYGGLYQWDEAMQYSTDDYARGICPTGWHIPNSAEYGVLVSFVNNDGNKLKELGQGTDAGSGTNASGFSALLSGYRAHGDFGNFGDATWLWTSSTSGILYLNKNDNVIEISTSSYPTYGFSVRCLKD